MRGQLTDKHITLSLGGSKMLLFVIPDVANSITSSPPLSVSDAF